MLSELRKICEFLFLARTELIGFFLLWPVSSWAFETNLLRGLADISENEAFLVSLFASALSLYLVVTTNLILLWGRRRIFDNYTSDRDDSLWRRRAVFAIGLMCLAGFLSAVRERAGLTNVTGKFMGGFALAFVVFAGVAWVVDRRSLGLVLLPLFPYKPHKLTGYQAELNHWCARLLIWLNVDEGYCERVADSDEQSVLPGHLFGLGVVLVSFIWVECYGHFLGPGNHNLDGWRLFDRDWTKFSTLAMLLSGWLLTQCILSALSFYMDRYRVPIFGIWLALATLSYWMVGRDKEFYSDHVDLIKLTNAPTPRMVLQGAPRRFVAVAAAGGGIQASGWTAQVLAGLKADKETGEQFNKRLKVISAVSGGSVGTIHYLTTYDNVWPNRHGVPTDEAIQKAMTSSLRAVAGGFVFSDLHELLVPFRFSRGDRGEALEQSFAEIAMGKGGTTGPKLLDIAPTLSNGLPMVLLNATLSEQAVPAVFSNGQFPDPGSALEHRRAIRGFHTDFRLETRLETAARVSATFPIVSPAARPSLYKSRDSFVDGGYFDNSGMYTLMAWMEQAAEGVRKPGEDREVLLLQIDAFPAAEAATYRRLDKKWYEDLTTPVTTVLGVRESGQAARTKYEFPLMAKSLEGKIRVERIEFRYKPSPSCSLESPPLSWHLSKAEKDCLREGWQDPEIRKKREQVAEWLRK